VSIHFGDNVNGVIPGNGLNIYAKYRVGGGSVGNLAANQIVDIASAITGVFVSGSSVTSGGTDAESIDQIRVNAPLAFTTQQRAVTLADYANLALSIPAVSQANAVANSYTNITVYMTATGNTVPSQPLLDQVQAYVQTRALAGTVVSTLAATRVPITVIVNIGVSSQYNPNSVQLQATQAVQNLFAPANVTMGVRIPVSKVYNTLATIPGVTFVNITELQRQDAAGASVTDILLHPYEIPILGTLTLTSTLSF
jgi:predicted phage baseplate assembly protein